MDPFELFLFVNALNYRRDVPEIAIAQVKLIASVNRSYDSDGEGGVWNGIGPAGFTHVIWNHQKCSPGIPVMWLMMRAASKLRYPWQHWKLCKLGRVIYFNVRRFDVTADSVSELSVPFSGHVFSSRGEFRNVFRNVVRTFFAVGKRRDRYCWLPPATVVAGRLCFHKQLSVILFTVGGEGDRVFLVLCPFWGGISWGVGGRVSGERGRVFVGVSCFVSMWTCTVRPSVCVSVCLFIWCVRGSILNEIHFESAISPESRLPRRDDRLRWIRDKLDHYAKELSLTSLS